MIGVRMSWLRENKDIVNTPDTQDTADSDKIAIDSLDEK